MQQQSAITLLKDYVDLHTLVSGEKPTELVVDIKFFDAYKKNLIDMAKVLGFQTQMKDSDVTYDGIKLVRKGAKYAS